MSAIKRHKNTKPETRPDETADYCQEAGPFIVRESFPAHWDILAANADIVCECDDADVAYYICEALNRQRKANP